MKHERKNNLFKQVPIAKVRRNLFDLSHEVKMSGKFGYLYPVLCMDTLPGDTIRDTMNVFARFAPLVFPLMHRLDVTTHFFFVPNRIICDGWQDFITGGQDGTDATVLPYVTPGGLATAGYSSVMQKGSIWDYLGLPLHVPPDTLDSTEQISVLPFRACAKVWNDYYRDPNLEAELDLNTELEGDVTAATGPSGIMHATFYRRGFEKDYFTSALPFAQRGEQVLMPLAGVASATDVTYKDESLIYAFDGTLPPSGEDVITFSSAGTRVLRSNPNAKNLRIENIEDITFENASTTINDFRRALAVQRWLEVNARGGYRYVEQIEGHFNVRVPDYRLQRAEYLGGGKQPVSISEVMSTANTETVAADTYVGDYAGQALSVGRTNTFTYRCQEHGWVIGFLSVTMRTAYSQGLPRMFTRRDKFDFAWPELANLGEQEIKSKEVFFSFDEADSVDNNTTFGYIPRYAEYKFMNDRMAGEFRGAFYAFHLGRIFTARPSLDKSFTTLYENGDGGSGVQDQDETNFRRAFPVVSEQDYIYLQLYHRLTAKRPLPYFGVPQIGS